MRKLNGNKMVLQMSLETLAEIESSGVEIRVSPTNFSIARGSISSFVTLSSPSSVLL